MAIPVIFIQMDAKSEYRGYFPTVVAQAKKHNKVIIIGDESTETPIDCHVNDYSGDCDEFEELFENLNTADPFYTFIQFKRYFVLRDFMRKNNIPVCQQLDTDVLIYSNATAEWEKFNRFDFTLTQRMSGHNSFFTMKGIDGFCNFSLETYRNKDSYDYEKIKSHFLIREKYHMGGGVCDMTFFEHYSSKIAGQVGEMMYIIDGSTYDQNIFDENDGYEMSNGIKKIRFIGEYPYCINKATKETIKFNTLHFVGGSKNMIKGFGK
jgi:hypothetical protein